MTNFIEIGHMALINIQRKPMYHITMNDKPMYHTIMNDNHL